MITSVMFDMGGTLEDIYVDERSEWAAIEKLDRMLREGGLDPEVDLTELKRRVDEGWKRYERGQRNMSFCRLMFMCRSLPLSQHGQGI